MAKAFHDPSDGDGFGDGFGSLGDGSGYGDGIGGAESAFDPANLEHREMGIVARGIADAARLLADKYHLVITNVPYLARGKQAEALCQYIEQQHGKAKQDLATAFVERCLDFCMKNGSTALVTPQNWLFLKSYMRLRKALLEERRWNLIARLGFAAFSVMDWWAFNTALVVISRSHGGEDESHAMTALDASQDKGPAEKIRQILGNLPITIEQVKQLRNPDAVVVLEDRPQVDFMRQHVSSYAGLQTGDNLRFARAVWELESHAVHNWAYCSGAPAYKDVFGGMSKVVRWGNFDPTVVDLWTSGTGVLRGREAWQKKGVRVGLMRDLPIALFTGEIYNDNAAVLIPLSPEHLPALFAYCDSDDFRTEVRKVNQKVAVKTQYLLTIPFDLEHWGNVAQERFPNGLPKLYSDDPTQWIFHGRPDIAETSVDGISAPLQVAVARLLGNRWPAETDDEMELSDEARTLTQRSKELLDLIDDDGIGGIPPVRGELPAADRVREMLALAYGDVWSPLKEGELLADAGFANKTLDQWLRDGFFKQHCKLLQNRPFIWHIWDGHKTGFQALVNYHQLADGQQGYKLLETLAFTYLGDWIRQLETAQRSGDGTAETRLIHARALQQNLHHILDGEAPYDIFVRWKPLQEQPIGWSPDLNDGVRMNDHHLTLEEKRQH